MDFQDLSQDQQEELERWFESQEGDDENDYAYYLNNWLAVYDVIVNQNGGISTSSVTEDYREIPVCVRRKAGLPIDSIASQFDYSYVDEFVTYVAAAHREWKVRDTELQAARAARRAAKVKAA